MHAILLLALLGQTLDIVQSTVETKLTAGQRTTLINHISARWGTVPLSTILSFDCARGTSGLSCGPVFYLVPTSDEIWDALYQGEDPPQIERKQTAILYNAASETAVAAFVAAVLPTTSGKRLQTVSCRRSGGDVWCRASYAQPMTKAEILLERQAGRATVRAR